MKPQDSAHPQGFPLSQQYIAQGYGKFPYVILRVIHGTYMQFPIVFTKEKNHDLKGISIYSEHDHPESQINDLLDAISEFKQNIEHRHKREYNLCLVLAKDQAYYYSGQEISFKNSIPSGGLLINSQQRWIALSHPHHI